MTATQGLRVIALEVENFKRLRAITITLDDGMQVISGRNGQGKTSAMDAIWAALGGAKATKGTPMPIHQGERKARVRVTLGRAEVPELIAERIWRANGSSKITVTAPDGAKHPKAQTVLDDLVGALSFDPLAFVSKPAKDQRAELLSLVELPFDPEELDAERKAIFDERTDVNRELRSARATLEGLPEVPDDVPATEVSMADLLAEHQAATALYAERRDAETHAADMEARVDSLRTQLAAAEADLVQALGAVRDLPPMPDVDAIAVRLRDVEATNQAVRAADVRRRLQADHGNYDAESNRLTTAIEQLDARKAAGLAEATMPIPGLGFDGDGVTFNGLPLSQASGAEQLRVSLAIAMAANPTLRLMLIRDGSLLDAEGLALVGSMAASNGYQVLVERVAGSGGPQGIVIEDGEVVDAETPEPDAFDFLPEVGGDECGDLLPGDEDLPLAATPEIAAAEKFGLPAADLSGPAGDFDWLTQS